jgi:hypothetical protein
MGHSHSIRRLRLLLVVLAGSVVVAVGAAWSPLFRGQSNAIIFYASPSDGRHLGPVALLRGPSSDHLLGEGKFSETAKISGDESRRLASALERFRAAAKDPRAQPGGVLVQFRFSSEWTTPGIWMALISRDQRREALETLRNTLDQDNQPARSALAHLTVALDS